MSILLMFLAVDKIIILILIFLISQLIFINRCQSIVFDDKILICVFFPTNIDNNKIWQHTLNSLQLVNIKST